MNGRLIGYGEKPVYIRWYGYISNQLIDTLLSQPDIDKLKGEYECKSEEGMGGLKRIRRIFHQPV